MIVYHERSQTADSRRALSGLQASLDRLGRSLPARHEAVVELLVELGTLEAAVVDALFPEGDGIADVSTGFRRASLAIGQLVWHSWRGSPPELYESDLDRLGRALAALAQSSLPRTVELRVPEGYAYYGLYPETYLEAATGFCADVHPSRAVVIGLRGIGASLSAVVAATLDQLGVGVDSYALRPHGHPFDRQLVLLPALERTFRARTDAYFLIVDEGPGLSGSSLAGAADRLSRLGIPDERIVFFPSWIPDEASLLSADARRRWRRHRKYTTTFEATWIDNGRLLPEVAPDALRDLSAGRWRALIYQDESEYPAVQPQHERRKYLCRTPLLGDGSRHSPSLLKFAGLGRYGRATLARAQRLAEVGFAPRALGLANGFLVLEFLPAQPARPRSVDSELLERIARYLAFIKREFPTGQSAPVDEIVHMVQTNTLEGLGPEWAQRLDPVACAGNALRDHSTVEIDGRMLPHEWLRTSSGWLKVDGTDHFADHFFPGTQDIAWDIAATCLEFALSRTQAEYLIERYQVLVRDQTIRQRLPFYAVTYAAYRLGYATLAAATMSAEPDGARWAALKRRYARQLRHAIHRVSGSNQP